MRILHIAPAAAALVVIAATASAAVSMTTSAQDCRALEHQFDRIWSQPYGRAFGMPTLAHRLYHRGSKLCASGSPLSGRMTLRQAVTDLGARPEA